jgi:hypothetical protein
MHSDCASARHRWFAWDAVGKTQHGIDGHDAIGPANSSIVWQATPQEKGQVAACDHIYIVTSLISGKHG